MIFIDSNIPMYLVGAPHPNKDEAQRLIELCVDRNERLVTDAEVLQEIIHRYAAIKRTDAIQPAFNALLGIVDEVFPIEKDDVVRAKDLLLGGAGDASARDLLHASVMQRQGVTQLLSFDRAFDRFGWLQRLQ